MKPSELTFFFEPKDRLRLTLGDRSYPTVVPKWASPLRNPGKYLSFLDGKGNEIVMVVEPSELPDQSREAALEEVARRYLTAQILEVLDAKGEWGATYWTVRTERGVREFVTQSLSENAQWLGADHILLIDVDGNRFELKDFSALDARSQQIVNAVL
jgi:hypothetical protein